MGMRLRIRLILSFCLDTKGPKNQVLIFQKTWEISTLLKSANSLRSNSTDFLRNALVFHPAERLLPEMATGGRGKDKDERGDYTCIPFHSSRRSLNDPYGSRRAEG